MRAYIFRSQHFWYLDVTFNDGTGKFQKYSTWAEAVAALLEMLEPKKAVAA